MVGENGGEALIVLVGGVCGEIYASGFEGCVGRCEDGEWTVALECFEETCLDDCVDQCIVNAGR